MFRSHPKKCTCGKDHIQSRAVSSHCATAATGGQPASSGLSVLQQRLAGKMVSAFDSAEITECKMLSLVICEINVRNESAVICQNVPYILAYRYVAPTSRKYFLRQILENLLMSRL